MSDQCEKCICRGDVKLCEAQSCSQHESWYVQAVKARVGTLRDEFAAAALTGYRAAESGMGQGTEESRIVARLAYADADAMLAEREKRDVA